MIRALFALLLLFGAAACGERAAETATTPAKPALWAVENARGDVAGWLFGTIHALPDGSPWETPVLTRVIDDADILVVEIRDLDSERTAVILKRLATDEPVPPLAERLPTTERRQLAELLESKSIPQDRFDGLETWAAALAVSRLAGTAPTANGADKALIARFAGRPITELEGAADQLAIFDRLPEGDQRSLFGAVLAEQADPHTDARALAAAWLAGDLAQLERTTGRGLLADPALYEELLARRNAAWLDRIVPMLDGAERPLVAVGTAHMLGPDGLPALLAAKGYRVRRIQ